MVVASTQVLVMRNRVRIGKGLYHLDVEGTKVWMHASCEEFPPVAVRVTKDAMSPTDA